MNNKELYKRFIAYLIDYLIVMILVSGLINIKQFNPFYDYMLESNNNYVKLANSYYQMSKMLPYYYEDERLDEDEYNKLLENNDTYKYLIKDAYQDKELSKEEYDNIKTVVTDDYNKNYPGLYYKYEKSMIYYYVIYLVIFLLYYVGFNIITKGRTLGKKIFKLKIVSEDNTEPKWYQYLVRSILLYNLGFYILRIIFDLTIPSTYLYNTLRVVYLLEIIVSYIILLSIPFSKNKRGIHEYLSKTRVEKE